MTITQTLGAEEAVKLVCLTLDRFAAPNRIPDHAGKWANYARLGNVEVWFHPHDAGKARFHCSTHDNVDIDVTVDFAELSREYLDDLVKRLDDMVNAHRAKRREADKNIVVLH